MRHLTGNTKDTNLEILPWRKFYRLGNIAEVVPIMSVNVGSSMHVCLAANGEPLIVAPIPSHEAGCDLCSIRHRLNGGPALF